MNNAISQLLKNWKTTSAGLTMIIGSGAHLAFAIQKGTANENTWTGSITGIIGGIGLLLAGDASQSTSPAQVAQAVDSRDTSFLKKPDVNKPNQ